MFLLLLLVLPLIFNSAFALKCYEGLGRAQLETTCLNAKYCLTMKSGSSVAKSCDESDMCAKIDEGCKTAKVVDVEFTACCCSKDDCNKDKSSHRMVSKMIMNGMASRIMNTMKPMR
ncbi:hypothetical protein L596_009955 [Steinernema carpocapsae]|uniref:UPAR/Ly6 domain-containing protein n=1 Tax=Steinernema carpocapsae TaxID=34508 RepID=A0A4U5PH56_STECR|nr:hypothetical protein L596_009955 [Steinernema carpocapsae]